MKRPVNFILLLLVLLGTVTAKAQHDIDSVDAQKRAVEYFLMEATGLQEQEKLDESFELLEYCRELDPESAAIQYLSTPYHIVLGDDSTALKMLEYIVETNPDNEAYCGALVQYYYSRCDWQAAITVYERLLETAKSKEEIYLALYTLYFENGDYEKALATLEDITKFIGSTTDVLLQKINLYLYLGRNDEAIELAKQMTDDNPDDQRFVYLLAEAYDLCGDHEMARNVYLQILEENPDDVIAMTSLISLYTQNEYTEEFEILAERLLKNEKFDSSERFRFIANYLIYLDYTDSTRARAFMQELIALPFCQLEHHEIYMQYLEYKEAPEEEILPVLDKIIELDPENVNAIIKQLAFAVDRNDADAVLKYSDEALLYLPHIIELYYYKGLSYFILEEEEKSVEVLEQGIAACDEETDPSLISSVYTLIGNIYNSLEIKEECYAAYDSALVYDPYNMEVLNNFSYYLSIDEKDLQKALDMSKKTLDIEPENCTYLDTYAWILFKMERYEEAKAYAEKILSFGTDLDYVVLHHIGDIYAKCGNIEKAVIYWQEAREAGDETKLLEKKIRKRKYYRGAKH